MYESQLKSLEADQDIYVRGMRPNGDYFST